MAKKPPAKKTSARETTAPRAATKGRSGGTVDAPGKKHRKALPKDPGAGVAASQKAKLRDVMPMAKTPRLRGRG